MRNSFKIFLGYLLLNIPSTVDAQHSSKGVLSIDFCNYVDSQVLQLDTAMYKNELGQTYSVTKFKYYISNIQLIRTDGTKFKSNEYFLIDEDEAVSKKIILNSIPAGEYQSITFTIGVDSLHNCSGAQSGALDPAKAMFWAWNTGYIFLKLEGKSSFSTQPGKIFEYHIGGYKTPNNCIRSTTLKFEHPLKISGAKNAGLVVKVDAAEALKTPNTIDLSTLSSVTDSKNATKIADNYSDMFTILTIRDEK